jgi:hypothetical protein
MPNHNVELTRLDDRKVAIQSYLSFFPLKTGAITGMIVQFPDIFITPLAILSGGEFHD